MTCGIVVTLAARALDFAGARRLIFLKGVIDTVLTQSTVSQCGKVHSPKANDLFFTKLAGLSAVLTLLPMAAQAAPYVRAGTAVYPDLKPVTAAPASPAPPAAEPTVKQTQAEQKPHGRHHVRLAGGKPVETKVAPTPAQDKANQSEQPRQDGPREAPAPTMADLVSRHARENGIPEKLANAVVQIESRYNPSARGGSALGLMQIKVQTARSMGFSGDWRGLMTPDTNLHFGMKVLADAFKTSRGDVCLTLAKYQSGHLTTRISAANRAYCARARAIMARL